MQKIIVQFVGYVMKYLENYEIYRNREKLWAQMKESYESGLSAYGV